MNDKMRRGWHLAIPLLLLWLTVPAADAAQLRYIRVGEYESLTRIVFEFDSSVKFTGPEIGGPGQVSVDFFDTTTDNPALQKMRDRSGRIEKIEFAQRKSVLTTRIGLTSSSFNLKTFYLFTPDRVVLDLYWTGAPVASVSTAPPVPEKTAPAASAPPVPENAVPPPVETTAGKAPETSVPGKEADSPPQQTSLNTNPLQSYLFVALIGFSVLAIIIVLFVTYIVLKKRRRAASTEGRVFPRHVAQGMEDRLDEESINTLDSRIQDELNKYGR